MNKIKVVEERITIDLNDAITYQNNSFVVTKDSTIIFDFDKSNFICNIEVKPDVTLTIISKNNQTKNIVNYNLNESSIVKVLKLGIDCSDRITINLNQENAKIDYSYSTINKEDNTYDIVVNHKASKTKSIVVNHGVNLTDKELVFNVNGYVPKESNDCTCNQDNKIIDLKRNHSVIKPNLFIDNYQVEANHSAYIGKFKSSELFYLMTRGIPLDKCYKLLLEGFLLGNHEVNDELKNWFLANLI